MNNETPPPTPSEAYRARIRRRIADAGVRIGYYILALVGVIVGAMGHFEIGVIIILGVLAGVALDISRYLETLPRGEDR